MKIELKRFKHYPRLSEETIAFNADLWIDGEKACSVSNAGHGGCTMFDDWKVADRVEAYAKTLPPDQTEFGALDMSADYLISKMVGDLVAEEDIKKFVRKLTKGVRRDDDLILVGVSDGQLEGVVVPNAPKAIEARHSQLRTKGYEVRFFDARGGSSDTLNKRVQAELKRAAG